VVEKPDPSRLLIETLAKIDNRVMRRTSPVENRSTYRSQNLSYHAIPLLVSGIYEYPVFFVFHFMNDELVLVAGYFRHLVEDIDNQTFVSAPVVLL
jgi:hypothetical protein